MQLRAYCRMLVIAGTLLIWTIKLLIRPYFEGSAALEFMLGVAPNLIGSFLIPFGAYWLYTHPRFFNGQLLRFSFFSDNRIVCLFGFTLLIINEYLQLIPVFGRTFDYYDLAFSAIGLTAAHYFFSFQQRKRELGIGNHCCPE